MNIPFDGGKQDLKLRMRVSQTNTGADQTVVDNEAVRAIVEKNPGNTDREYAEEIDVFPSNILRYLKLIGKV